MTFRYISALLIVTGLVTAVTFTGCKRASKDEDNVPGQPVTAEEPASLSTVSFPVANSIIGISLSSAPEGLVATFNDRNWIELTDSRNPRVLYTFSADDELQPRVEAPSIEEFESDIRRYDDGAIVGQGSLETALGDATWSAGTFSEDGNVMEKIYLLAPHPSGVGFLTVTSVCPPDAASVEERLSRIKELLQYVG